MKTDEIREKYLEFFVSKGHARRASDVLVPHGDPSVLFTPAGMNQFKDHFLGKVKLDFTRATTCQKCLRTGDIDNVGRTAFHHTFFEMLGNFSFGDYFKREAITWAWEFLTSPKWLGIDPERLKVTVFLDDDEAAEIWHREIGLPLSRITRMGEDDNFWPAGAPTNGPDGVCGPCSEIFYHDDKGVDVEIWNLVFTQFNRVGEPPDNLRPLPSKNIDTGMGLERIASVMQGVTTNYHIDSLRPIVEAAAQVVGRTYEPTSEDGRRLRRITDHVRAATFAIHENVEPDSKKQGYVIRRLLRRAVLDGHQMGMREPFLHQLVGAVVEAMKGPYPELAQTASRVADEIRLEERTFLGTIEGGMARVRQVFDAMASAGRKVVSGDEAADLYTTFGVPPELFQQIAAESGYTFDWEGYRAAMTRHGEISGGQQIELFKTGAIESIKAAVQRTEFLGYDASVVDATVRGIVVENRSVDALDGPGTEATIVLDRSPFYGESGGQVGDTGRLVAGGALFEVLDTRKDAELLLHVGRLVSGTLTVGATVKAEVDSERRDALRRAHSATHLLHHALQSHLGEQAQQRGSKVEPDQFRFDFRQREQIAPEILESIEVDVRKRVAQDAPVSVRFMPIADARREGAMMLFGEKYPETVRMVSMGDFSKEL
ncbi:MAG TPA: alanine--tRNA ligase, partial [Pirellulaceae bacterium]|nr:alanine--tRNA ligase [Pirellulaceae bacterium]